MLISDIDICNMALANIGSPPIQSLVGPQPSQRACKLRYQEARLEALAGNLWNFASMYRKGSRLAIEPKAPYAYVFIYPPDALRIFEIQHPPGTVAPPFEVTDRPDAPGKIIHCNVENPTFVYTRDKQDPASFDVEFVQALSWLLASKVAMPITKSMKLQQEAYKMWLSLNSNATASNRNEGLEDTDQTATYQDAR